MQRSQTSLAVTVTGASGLSLTLGTATGYAGQGGDDGYSYKPTCRLHGTDVADFPESSCRYYR